MSRFQHNLIRDLAHQLVFSPVAVRKKELVRAEKLVDTVDPDKDYPYEFVCYQITGYRPRGGVSPALGGEGLRQDLVRLIEFVSESVGQHVADVRDRVYSIGELAERFKVSTKTIQRWRRMGLVSRRFVFPDGRMRHGFLASSVERFARRHEDKLRAASQFRRLAPGEHREVIRQARRLSLYSGCSPSETARRISRDLGRSVEAIRQAIKQYDREHPDSKLFPMRGDPLGRRAKEFIFGAYRRGVSASTLGRRFLRSRSSIHRIVNSQRVAQLSSRPVKYVHNAEFERPDADSEILGAASGAEPTSSSADRPVKLRTAESRRTLPDYLRSLYRTPLLSGGEERALFRAYNYLKYKAAKQIEGIAGEYEHRAHDIDRIEAL
ncbi:MAG: RNA polymerase subunit sigma-70, partial [Phycisphaerae bacterium]|nr:RNA polymerase subunit sigma-70 [Phycisphaerae bacterium]